MILWLRAWWERRRNPPVYVHHPRCSIDHLGMCVFLDPMPSHLDSVNTMQFFGTYDEEASSSDD